MCGPVSGRDNDVSVSSSSEIDNVINEVNNHLGHGNCCFHGDKGFPGVWHYMRIAHTRFLSAPSSDENEIGL